jgi:hypothetical protein
VHHEKLRAHLGRFARTVVLHEKSRVHRARFARTVVLREKSRVHRARFSHTSSGARHEKCFACSVFTPTAVFRHAQSFFSFRYTTMTLPQFSKKLLLKERLSPKLWNRNRAGVHELSKQTPTLWECCHLNMEARLYPIKLKDYWRISIEAFAVFLNKLELRLCGPGITCRSRISAGQRLDVTAKWGKQLIKRKSYILYSCSYSIDIHNGNVCWIFEYNDESVV